MTNTDDSKQAAAHSPEPWHVEPLVADHGGSIAVCNRQQGILAVIPPLNEDDGPDADTARRGPCDEANARRIVAAVNACRGLSTEALEQGVVGELLEALQAQQMAEYDPEASRRKGYFDRARALRGAALAKAAAAPVFPPSESEG